MFCVGVHRFLHSPPIASRAPYRSFAWDGPVEGRIPGEGGIYYAIRSVDKWTTYKLIGLSMKSLFRPVFFSNLLQVLHAWE